MQNINYIVTFMGNCPCGGRHPLTVKTKASGVEQAIFAAKDAIEDERVEATDLLLLSVEPESYPFSTDDANSDEVLAPCPFCGNSNVSLVETRRESDSENMYFVNCGCCNASQLPDSKEGAISNWNQRNEDGK
ncbi:Lar family restriction alleviation protein [Serratia ficaria]|uniref:Lar family restriction alleviation protein n=1 Tax=Serratia ficaria TaxID=61651 RepID=UPI000E39CB78|nr:Lar family restriction alleviation protein [Serratia ficaria]REF42125.1 Lar family restriction alleviation protein [Serratia ficaria]CAI1045813.1 restriction alleviation protein, Lar family [Serratia ficaria]CAI1105176.1 restriction alleviation protein, Lar family [Serratia ficaria]CAI1200301.1 restriction alleviation protein, Lar family [Serratia ficaria]CAI1849599.1 restriction alleviation protein, Lar family [Serratia ficaria]